MLLTKALSEQLANPEPVVLKAVTGFGCDVRIRPLSGVERITYIEKTVKLGDDIVTGLRIMAELVVLSVVDEDGKAVFDVDDTDHVLSLNMVGLQEIATAAAALSGFNIEEAEENS